ncbi:hypothetical protein [Halorussus sp. MSC15.2]|uniref:hypothetical protein n=1 Tax=Halorussus sp. MSC15.2 TaxID=2283638 RepID=UPI0013D236DB|nr:hypothetical protein [Halorussus sp. MSC15.2]NEU58283.1 hypothetical protein [Halorussus sp. MSC15.2]
MNSEVASPAQESDFPAPVYLLAAHLAVLVAVIHVTLGLYNWIRWASAGFLVPRDLRWPLFVFSGVALVVGLVLATRGRYRRPLYLGGIALMAVYVGGYFAWHATGHRPLLLFGEGAGHTGPLVPFLLDHLFAGPVKFLALTSEVALAVVLAYLFVRESP